MNPMATLDFSAFEFPMNPADVTLMYNDVGVGYFLYRDPDFNSSKFLMPLKTPFFMPDMSFVDTAAASTGMRAGCPDAAS